MWEFELPCLGFVYASSRRGQSSLTKCMVPSLEHVCFEALPKLLKQVMSQWPTPMGKTVCLLIQVLVTFYEYRVQVGVAFCIKLKRNLTG